MTLVLTTFYSSVVLLITRIPATQFIDTKIKKTIRSADFSHHRLECQFSRHGMGRLKAIRKAVV